MIVLGASLFLFLIIAGVPLAIATGGAVISYMLTTTGIPLSLLAQKMYTTTNNFTMLAIPLFILAGELMNGGGLTKKLVNLASDLTGHIRGSLAHVTILASMLFASMSGSSSAACASIGSMMIPAMKEKKYDGGFAAAVTSCSSVIGPIIPPSIAFVIYCSMTNDSIGQLFLAGYLPGIVMGLCLMLIAYFIAKKNGYPTEPKASWSQRAKSFLQSLPAMMMPVIIIGGILGGIFTATEAGAIAALYGLLIGLISGNLKLNNLLDVFLKTAKTSSAILLIIGTSQALGWILTSINVPQKLASAMLGFSTNPLIIFLLVIALVLFLGMFLVDAAILTLVVPLMYPLAMKVGINHLQFAVAFNMTCVLGGVTPPVGALLYIATGIGDVPIFKAIKALIPFFFALLIAILLVILIPQLSTFIPGLFE